MVVVGGEIVEVAKRPVDLVRAAVDQCSDKQRRWLACC